MCQSCLQREDETFRLLVSTYGAFENANVCSPDTQLVAVATLLLSGVRCLFAENYKI